MPTIWPYIKQDVEKLSERPWNIDQVNAPSFCERTRGGGAVVAIVDTGIDLSHPEFAGRIFNPMDMTGDGIADIEGHGTHVAGIIAGASCGVAPEARIMPIKVFHDDSAKDGNTNIFIQDAFREIWQFNKTAPYADKVIAVNCSFGSQGYDPLMAYLIRSLVSQGVTVVVSAGNSGDGNPETAEIFSYPAYIWECLTVGAMNQDGTGAVYSSSYDGIDVGAPGTLIYSSWPGNRYKLLSGTSMAAPHITGAMALIYSAWRDREGSWPTEEQAVKVLLKHTKVVPIDPVFIGEGRLDLTWDFKRWPLNRVQLGAFWRLEGAKTKQAQVRALGLETYLVKY